MAEFLVQYVPWPAWHWLVYLGVGLFQVLLILALVMLSVAVYNWMERKVSAANSGPAGAQPGRRPVRLAPIAGRRSEASVQGRL